jgi:uncharacterized membrane protein
MSAEIETQYDEHDGPATSRMVVALMALIGLVISIYTFLFKLGLLGMACGTGACETVQLSPWATQLGVPVSAWGLVGYGVMFVATLMGLQPRFQRARWVSIIILGGSTFALLFTLYLSYLEQMKIHAWCRWCLGSAAAVVVMFVAALPELKRLRTTDQD